MSLASVRAHLATFGRDGDVIVPEVSSATVELAAAALGVEPARIAKTIALRTEDPDTCLLVVAAGDARTEALADGMRLGLTGIALVDHAMGLCP